MIYLVTNNQELFNDSVYKIISIKDSLKLLDPLKIVGLDTETTGLSCWSDQLLSVQLGCFDFQIVIDCLTINIIHYKTYLESDRLFIAWNAKFDLQWLFRKDIWPKNIYDGYLAEKLMWLGYPIILNSELYNEIKCSRYTPIYNNSGEISHYTLQMSLKKAGEMYLGIELDKNIRGKIIYQGITPETIKYCADDVKYLQQIMDAQKVELAKKDLLISIKYENAFIIPLAYMEYCGIKLDINKWEAKMKKDKERESKALLDLNNWLLKNMPNSKYIVRDSQGDLFNGFNLEPTITLNWNSQSQLIPIFKSLGVNIETGKTGEEKDSLNAKVLGPQKDKTDLIPIYLNYKEAVKVTSTYGKNFIDQINPVSGRIHTNYQAIGTDTGRISSGGKDKNGNQLINLLNIPADAETRACFVAETGNSWISIDYSGQETYLMASIANDKAIIKELTEGSGDIHSLTAYMSFKDIPRDTPIKDIKKLYHDKRQSAKSIEFAINYGGNADTISKNSGLPIEEATEIYNNYMSGFSGLAKYQSFCRKDVMEKGYILLNPKTHYKAFIYDFPRIESYKKSFQEPGFWDYYRDLKQSNPNSYTVQKVKTFFKRKSSAEKQSINYRIQHTGAACIKVAMIKFFAYLREKNLFNIVKICVMPYDECNIEAPKDIAEQVAKKLYNCMIEAGAYFCTRCKLDADISRLPNGTLPTYWIH